MGKLAKEIDVVEGLGKLSKEIDVVEGRDRHHVSLSLLFLSGLTYFPSRVVV